MRKLCGTSTTVPFHCVLPSVFFFCLQETLTHPSMPHWKVSSSAKPSLTSKPEQTSPFSRLQYSLLPLVKVAFIMFYLGLPDKPGWSVVARTTSPSFFMVLDSYSLWGFVERRPVLFYPTYSLWDIQQDPVSLKLSMRISKTRSEISFTLPTQILGDQWWRKLRKSQRTTGVCGDYSECRLHCFQGRLLTWPKAEGHCSHACFCFSGQITNRELPWILMPDVPALPVWILP